MSHDLVKQAQEFKKKHREAIDLLNENIRRDYDKPACADHLANLSKILNQFLKSFGYTSHDEWECRSDIERVLEQGFKVKLPSNFHLDFVEDALLPELLREEQPMKQQAKSQAKQTKRQETKMYPPRYTTSKPQPPKDMTSSVRAKLNLKHIQQVHQPQSISPSENTRKPTLSMSKSSHTGRDDKLDYSFGQISGIEADNRIWNTEGSKYFKAFDRINDHINELPKKTGIHATNNVRASMKKLKHSKEISKRLTSWR